MRNNFKIDLRLSFEENIKRALALPRCADCPDDHEIVGALRRLYDLAHGRSVETGLGLIAIAPPVATSLSLKAFSVATRPDLLTAVQNQTAAAFPKS